MQLSFFFIFSLKVLNTIFPILPCFNISDIITSKEIYLLPVTPVLQDEFAFLEKKRRKGFFPSHMSIACSGVSPVCCFF